MLPTFKLQNLAATAQANVPVTFGQVFAPGDFKADRGLLGGASDGTYLPIQVDVKAAHPDGSVRHAILSMVVPAIGAKGTRTYRLLDADKRSGIVQMAQVFATAEITLIGMDYVAKLDSAGPIIRTWLSGPAAVEQHYVVPFVSSAGVEHAHLMAHFAVRDYGVNQRVDFVIENCWAFEPGPQNFKYDAALYIGSTKVYEKKALTHTMHGRWRKLYWTGAAPQINVQNDPAYLIASRAVPNYDMSLPPSEPTLQKFAAWSLNSEPMQTGAASGYFPTTGASEELGIMPMWDAGWVMSQDVRARDCMLVTGTAEGSYPVHFRDKATGLPVSLKEYPYMTIAGNPGDTWNPKTKLLEKFATPGNDRIAAGLNPIQALNKDGTLNTDDVPWKAQYTIDMAHQPSLALGSYIASGDFYFWEELKSWALWNSFWDNPNYRGAGKGLVVSGELRAQAWGLRTIAEAAAFAPPDDPSKDHLLELVNNNLKFYEDTYINGPLDNKIGVPTHGGSIAHDNGVSIAPWMHDYFVSVLGHMVRLGFKQAKPFLMWMGHFTVGRMIGPGVCWIWAAEYDLQIRDFDSKSPTGFGPVYESLLHSYKNRAKINQTLSLPCAGPEMAAVLGRPVGDMGNISDGNMGYPAWYQPALAALVDAEFPGADEAWLKFMSRSVKPDYTQGAQFAIIPEELPTTLPEGNTMTFKITIEGFDSAVQQLAPGSESALSAIRVRVMSPDGVKVLGESSTLPYSLGGLDAGVYPLEIAALDSTGAVMGVAATLTIDTASAPVVTPPALPVSVSLPSAIRASVVQES